MALRSGADSTGRAGTETGITGTGHSSSFLREAEIRNSENTHKHIRATLWHILTKNYREELINAGVEICKSVLI